MTFLLGLALVAALAGVATIVLAMVSWRAPELGPVDGRLRPCPPKPNCVCSQDADGSHATQPLRPSGDAAAGFERLVDVLAARDRVQLLHREPGYARLEFRTAVLRFADDVELMLAEDEGVIHVRSASRVGHSDLGANGARVADLRVALAELEGR